MKILLLSDHVDKMSGVGIMSKNIVLYSPDEFEWVQLGGATKKGAPEIIELQSDSATKSIKVYPYDTYGDRQVLLELIHAEKPDAILHFTDPRFWTWLYEIEYEVREIYKIPLIYYSVWDNYPHPKWNKPYYNSVDTLIAISKLTHRIHESLAPNVTRHYVPHGVDSKVFYPIIGDAKLELEDIRAEFCEKHNCKHIFFWNNINMRRKSVLTLIDVFAKFYRNGNKDCALVLHTNPIDQAGTDLLSVKRDLYDDVNIIFSPNKISQEQLNIYYNLATATINISANEGFGLTTLEAAMAGCRVILLNTGGLADQIGKDTIVIDVDYKAMNGHPNTPYIIQDFPNVTQLLKAFDKAKKLGPADNKARYSIRTNAIKKGMTSDQMSYSICSAIKKTVQAKKSSTKSYKLSVI